MKNVNRLGLAFMLGALLAYLTACASLPAAGPSERSARDAAACLESGPCFVIQADNGAYYEAKVYVNSFYVGRVAGNHARPIFVRESLLVDGRCAQVSVQFRDVLRASVSSKECIRPGGLFSLSLDPRYRAWLTPWGGR